MPPALRSSLALLTSALLLCTPAIAFNTPLSDQAVREAYFLGQRRDESMMAFLNKYTKALPPPKPDPYISPAPWSIFSSTETSSRRSPRLSILLSVKPAPSPSSLPSLLPPGPSSASYTGSPHRIKASSPVQKTGVPDPFL